MFWASVALLLGPAWTKAAERLPWEIAPYRTLVWLDVDRSCRADEAYLDRLAERLKQRRYATSGSVLATDFTAAPWSVERWQDDSADAMLFAKQLENLGMRAEEYDRIHLVSIQREGTWEIAFREYDTLTRSWGSTHHTSVTQRDLLPSAILRIANQKFAPLAKITDVDKPNVALALRGTTLLEEEKESRQRRLAESIAFVAPTEKTDWKKRPALGPSEIDYPDTLPGTVDVGEAMQPVLRRNDRQGNLVSNNGILFMPWTYVSCEANNGLQLTGTMISGYNRPLPGRRNVRTQRLAIGIRPVHAQTELKLVDKATESVPLAGYEIYSKDPDGPNLVGASDANGNVLIPKDPNRAVRLLYVRSGGNLLARLPVVPGHEPATTARITNDSPRLLAEGFVEGWRDQLVDTMARRQILAQRVERKIDQGELEEAEKWLGELRAGRTVNELAYELRSAKGQFLKENKLDPTIKRRIDDLFEKGQRLVSQDKSLLVEGDLAKDLEQAKKGQP